MDLTEISEHVESSASETTIGGGDLDLTKISEQVESSASEIAIGGGDLDSTEISKQMESSASEIAIGGGDLDLTEISEQVESSSSEIAVGERDLDLTDKSEEVKSFAWKSFIPLFDVTILEEVAHLFCFFENTIIRHYLFDIRLLIHAYGIHAYWERAKNKGIRLPFVRSKLLPNLRSGGPCRNFAYYSMLIIQSWQPKGGAMAQCPPKYAPGCVHMILELA